MQKFLVEKRLITAIKILFFLTLFTPLILGEFGLNFSEYPKGVFFRSLVEMIFLLYVFLVLLDKKYLPKFSILAWSVLIYDAVLLLSGFFGINPYRSFFGDLTRGEGTVMHVHLFVFFIILISIFPATDGSALGGKEKKDWLNLFKVAVIVSGISTFCGLLQIWGVANFYAMAKGMASGTLSNPDLFAYFNVLAIFLAISVLIVEENKFLKYVFSIILALDFLTLFSSSSRGAFAGLLSGLAVIVIYYYFKMGYKKRLTLLLTILGLSVLAFFAFSYPQAFHLSDKTFFSKFVSVFKIGLGDRADLYDMSMRSFQERPVLGWGPEIFSFVFDKHFIQGYPGLGSDETSIYFDRPHSKILEVAVASGTLGILSYFFVFFVIFYLIAKYFKSQKSVSSKERLLSVVLASFFVAYFVQNTVAFDNICNYILFFIVAGYINNNFIISPKTADEAMAGAQKPKRQAVGAGWTRGVACIVATLLVLIIFYQLNVKPTLAGMDFASHIRYERLHPEIALQGYKKGISRNTLYDKDLTVTFIDRMLFLTERGAVDAVKADVMKALLELRPALNSYLEQEDQNKKFLYGDGVTLNQHLYLYYKDPQYLDEVERVAQSAINFNPNFPSFYQYMGTAKILKGEDQAGEDYMRKSYDIIELKKIDDEFRYLYETGAAYLKRGDVKKAGKKFEEAMDAVIRHKKYTGDSITLVDMGTFIDSLAITIANYGDFEWCKKIYKKGAEAYPEYKQVFEAHLQALASQMKQK